MQRFTFALALALAPAVARAESLPEFSLPDCETDASHVVVADAAGAVLESWRGDLKPGDRLPMKEFRLPAEYPVSVFGRTDDPPKKVTGKRFVLFLKRGGGKYGTAWAVGSWEPANWQGGYDTSALWVEGEDAFGIKQWFSGKQEMSRLGTVAEIKKGVAAVNAAVDGLFAKARAEKDPSKRAGVLGGVVRDYPGFSAEALAGLEWTGEAALPALRDLAADKVGERRLLGDVERLGVYRAMALLGTPARDDLMKVLDAQLAEWKSFAEYAPWAKQLDRDHERLHRWLLVVTQNPEAFAGATAAQHKTLRGLRDLWATDEVLSKLGAKGDRVQDRLNRALAKLPR